MICIIVTYPPVMWQVLDKMNKTQYLAHDVTIQMEGNRTESHEKQNLLVSQHGFMFWNSYILQKYYCYIIKSIREWTYYLY